MGQEKKYKILLNEGHPLYIAADKSYNQWGYGNYPSKNHIEILKILLAHGADPNLPYRKCTAMDAAGNAGCADALAMLLPITNKNPIILGKMGGIFPWYTEIMFESFRSGDWLKILKLLNKYGADFNQKNIYNEKTLLHLVMQNFPSLKDCEDRIPGDSLSEEQRKLIHDSQCDFFKHIRLLDFLLENGAKPSIEDGKGDTPLHYLLAKIDLDHIVGVYAKIIDKCLLKGFDINAVGCEGWTLLHVAADGGKLNAVKYLLARGANVNAINKIGKPPLFYVAGEDPSKLKRPRITQLLLEHGINPNITDIKHLTPIPFSNEKPEASDQLTQETQLYVNEFNSKVSNLSLLSQIPLKKKDKELLGNYIDDISHEFMEIPVILNVRVYDFKTLEKLKDPVTGQPFNLSDIKPAKEIAIEIADLVQYLNDEKSLNKDESSPKNNNFIIMYG